MGKVIPRSAFLDLYAGPMVQLPRESLISLRTCGGQMGPANKSRDDGYGVFGDPSPREGALLTSHGETVAGLMRSLKDDAPRRRRAAARRAVLD